MRKLTDVMRSVGRWLTVGPLLLTAACGSPTGIEACESDGGTLLGGEACLVLAGDAVQGRAVAIEDAVRRALEVAQPVLPLTGVRIRVDLDGAGIIPEIGIGGRAFEGERVVIAVDPTFPFLDQSIAVELPPLLSHELHHIARQRTVGYGADLLSAMISEGLADHFAVEAFGVTPPLWSTALSGADLDTWSANAVSEWTNRNYDHNAWFFGTGQTIPRWAGYAIGFSMVQEFLDDHPGRRASDLHDEPAMSFTP